MYIYTVREGAEPGLSIITRIKRGREAWFDYNDTVREGTKPGLSIITRKRGRKAWFKYNYTGTKYIDVLHDADTQYKCIGAPT